MDVVRNENGSYSAHVFARQAIHIVENHAKQSQNKVHKHYIFPFVSKDHIFTVRIGSILNPLVRKFSEDTRKKGKGAETGASQDWRSFYLSHMIGLKGSHMTKVHCSLASEWNRLFILWICGAKYSLFVVPHTGMIYNRLSNLSHTIICFSDECDSGIIGYNLTDRGFVSCLQPLFLYLPFQSVHGPLQAPEQYTDKYRFIKNKARRTYAGQCCLCVRKLYTVL